MNEPASRSPAITKARAIVTIGGEGPVRGDAAARLEVIEGATVKCAGGVIASLTTDHADAGAGTTIDASGCLVLPGFVDCHTHVPFYGWRGDEDAARLSGVRYEELHGRSGGIFRSAEMLAAASDDEVVEFAVKRANAMLRAGTTCFEMKSGYGLSVEAELRHLRLARRVSERVKQLTQATCLAAHAVPPRMSAGEWIGIAASELLPAVAEEGLAEACDIYVETIAFALEHAARLTDTAKDLGLRMRVHADQLEDNQTGAFAARWGLATTDHLNHTGPDAVGDIAGSDTVAVLLPGATFTLQQAARPPARALLDEGAVVALATDFNPGTSPISSMLLVTALACRLYSFTPAEAFAAATVNGAAALAAGDHVGRIAEGYRADLLVVELDSIDELAYRPDSDPIRVVVCGGEVAHVAPGSEWRISERGSG